MENKMKYISVPEFAKMLGISRIAVFKKIKNGQILAEKIGRNYAISANVVANYIKGNETYVVTEEKKKEINTAVGKIIKEYGETLRLLGKE